MDAPWEFPFDPAVTTDAGFTTADGTVVQVPTMRYDEFLPSVWREDLQAVELPYGDGALSMIIIQPNDFASDEQRRRARVAIARSVTAWRPSTRRRTTPVRAAAALAASDDRLVEPDLWWRLMSDIATDEPAHGSDFVVRVDLTDHGCRVAASSCG